MLCLIRISLLGLDPRLQVYDGVALGSEPPRSSGDTNFAGVIAADGSVVGIWRGGGAGRACNASTPAQHCNSGGFQFTARAAY